jgi:hypothetical protein
VQEGALYLARPADLEVEMALRSGGLCLVLGPPGSGRSSLRAQVGRTLAAAGVSGAHLPLGKLPAATPAAFCLGLMQGLGRALNLPPLGPFFQRYAEQHGDSPPAARLTAFLRQLVIGSGSGPVVIFFDDLDALDSACAEALCTALQAVYTMQDDSGPLRLGVCLTSKSDLATLGVALPATALRVVLPAFSRSELESVGPALGPLCRDFPESARPAALAALLDVVADWTGGQPYLTQHLCQQLVARATQSSQAVQVIDAGSATALRAYFDQQVERLGDKLFPAGEVGDDPLLVEMERRLTHDRRAPALLALWRRIWRGDSVVADPSDRLQVALWLAGFTTSPELFARADGHRLAVAGRLVARVFNDDWARTQEARQLLNGAVSDGEAAKLRGAALKTAQTWAVRHPERLSVPELRALLLALEAARVEAELRHQASATSLQRDGRERAEQRAEWSRERGELTSLAEQAQRKLRWLSVVAVLLLIGCLGLGYLALKRRSSSSPHSPTSPAPRVMNRSPGRSSASTAAAISLRLAMWTAPGWPWARSLPTSRADDTPAIGSSPAA